MVSFRQSGSEMCYLVVQMPRLSNGNILWPYVCPQATQKQIFAIIAMGIVARKITSIPMQE